jgi:prophage antirepressor-like protein
MEQTETLVFENKNLRIIGTIDNPLFTLKDVCEILKIKNITDCSNTIPKEHKDIKKVESASGYYSMIVINQKALLKLCMKSKNIYYWRR